MLDARVCSDASTKLIQGRRLVLRSDLRAVLGPMTQVWNAIVRVAHASAMAIVLAARNSSTLDSRALLMEGCIQSCSFLVSTGLAVPRR